MKGLILLLMVLASPAAAQYSAPVQEALALAPQLEAFAGSKANFESLAAGLRAGRQVTLVTITPDGMREIVSFTAAKPLSAEESARVLENARYHLLDRGRATPSGWDIALVLMGHMDITPAGPVRQPGLLAPADPRKPMVMSLRAFAGSAANYRSLMRGLTEGKLVILADPVHTRFRERFMPQCALPEADARQVLIAAAERLAAQHIGDPMIDELRAAVLLELESKCGAAAS
ncbi:MAG: hypothetical protein ACJ8G5_08880 [Burkholderiales bacterium]